MKKIVYLKKIIFIVFVSSLSLIALIALLLNAKDPRKEIFEELFVEKLLFDNSGKPLLSGINRCVIYESFSNFNDYSMEEYLERMAESNIKILRIFLPEGPVGKMCEERYGGFENIPGEYDEGVLNSIDELFELADKYDIYIIFNIFDAYRFNECWEMNAYSVFSDKKEDFFINEEINRYQKKRVEFIVKRYKEMSHLLAWEPINEIKNVAPDWFDLNRKENGKLITKWFEDMAIEIKSIDSKHLITQSVGGGVIIPSLFKSEYLDIIQPHLWAETRNPDKISNLMNYYIDLLSPYDKPIIIGEFASLKDNPKRLEFIETALRYGKSRGVPVLLWTTRNGIYGGMDDSIFDIYKEVYK